MKIATREYREMQLMEIVLPQDDEAEDRKIVTGYATTFNDEYVLFEDDEMVYSEVVDPAAFDGADMSDVIMQYDHAGRVFARTRNATLRLQPNARGLLVEADLGGTALGRQLYDEIRGGYTDKMSFGFTVRLDDVTRETLPDGRVKYLRRIKEIAKLFDVSAVSLPANGATSIGAVTRGLIDGAIEEVRAERLAAEKMELEKRRIKARAKALALGGRRND